MNVNVRGLIACMRFATPIWSGLVLAASASLSLASPSGPAQGHVGGSTASLVTGRAHGNADASTAQATRDAESQCGLDISDHWALYQRLANRRAPESPSRPDFSGLWTLADVRRFEAINQLMQDLPDRLVAAGPDQARPAGGGAR